MPAASPTELRLGTSTRVAAPATSANVGPGFDAFGLALDWRDDVTVEVIDHGYEVDVTGEGAAEMPRDDSHLVLASTVTGLRALGLQPPGLRLQAHNTIPHGRGLGSSSAAIVAGLLAACGLAGVAPEARWLLRHATAIEGHPDNVAAAIQGGFALAYGDADDVAAVSVPVHSEVAGWLFVAEDALATSRARRLLPNEVPHRDAAANAARAALLVHALGAEPELLWEATRDWLHTRYRASAMPLTANLMAELRTDGWAAVLSGAGPSVLVLGRAGALERLAEWAPAGFRGRPIDIGTGGRIASE